MSSNKGISEKRIQDQARLDISKLGLGISFRVNVGQAWTGSSVKKLSDGSLLISNPRPFNTGLPPGTSDLIGLTPMKITQQHVGSTLGVFFALEAKTPTGKLSDNQSNFLNRIDEMGGIAGVFRSPDQATAMLKLRHQA